MVAGDDKDGEQRQLQGVQGDGMASPERGGGPGRVALSWEGLELPRRPEGIAGELELGDGGPRPARPGYSSLYCVWSLVKRLDELERPGASIFIARGGRGVSAPPATPGHCAGDERRQ